MEKYIISLSSNENAEQNLSKVERLMADVFDFVKISSVKRTEPIGTGYPADFYNAAALISTSFSPEELKEQLKKMECQMGRTPEMKKRKIVPIDLDIICHNGDVVHADYFRFDFLRQLIVELK